MPFSLPFIVCFVSYIQTLIRNQLVLGPRWKSVKGGNPGTRFRGEHEKANRHISAVDGFAYFKSPQNIRNR